MRSIIVSCSNTRKQEYSCYNHVRRFYVLDDVTRFLGMGRVVLTVGHHIWRPEAESLKS